MVRQVQKPADIGPVPCWRVRLKNSVYGILKYTFSEDGA